MLIALTGYACSGKDEVAAPLIARGFKGVDISDLIKQFFYSFAMGATNAPELRLLIKQVNPNVNQDDLSTFMDQQVFGFLADNYSINPFTEDNAEKAAIRPLLETRGRSDLRLRF